MKKDITVIISIGLLAMAWIIGSFFDTLPGKGDPGWWLYLFSLMLAILGTARALLLWFQTLRYVAQQPRPFPRGKWIFLHIVAAPVVPYLFYFIVTQPGVPPDDEPAPTTEHSDSDDHPES